MSLFLLPDAEIYGKGLRIYSFSKEKLLKYQRGQQKKQLDINFELQTRKNNEFTAQVTRQDAIGKEFLSIASSTLPNYKNLIRMQLNKKTGHICISMNILSPQQTYFMVQNIRSLPQISIKVKNLLRKEDQNFVTVAFNPVNGQFKMLFPLYTGFESYFRGTISKNQSIIEYINRNYVEVNFSLLKMIVSQNSQQGRVQTYAKANSLESAQRYLDISHVRSLVTQSIHIPEQEILHVQRGRKIDLQQIVKHKIRVEQHLFNTCLLFEAQLQLKSDSSTKNQHIQLSEEEQRYIARRISMPVLPKPMNNAQNLFILNYIYVFDLSSMKLRHINEGGFSSIFLTQMQYICAYPTPGYVVFRLNQSDISNHKNIINKRVIVKKEEEECSFSRNQHQLKVIKSIKESSVFLPKYYIPLNKPNPHSGAVFMDYIPFQTLTEFMTNHTHSSSLRSKLILIFSIIQSLRFLRDQKVVHLDLKPSNIMIYHNLLIKLIDFGESYQPQVCHKNHRPGFTIPYSSPQIFSNQTKQFTSKSDVFSLGVIMFEILYRCYPYDILEATELIDDIMENYLKKWLFVPEEYERYGDVRILRIMNACISKCLSPATTQRPELDWLSLIVRCSIDYIE